MQSLFLSVLVYSVSTHRNQRIILNTYVLVLDFYIICFLVIVQKLLDKIGDKESLFVIGQIKQVNYTDQYLLERNHKLKGRYNARLKKLGKRLGLTLSLDISMARDAYANTHKRAGTNPLKISENMNHSDPRTTTLHYLDNFEFDSDVDVNDVLL
jgi:hypothetical protein